MKLISRILFTVGLLALVTALYAYSEGDVRFVTSPSCSPDGKTVIFATNAFSDVGDLSDLWTVNINGTGLACLTNTPDLNEDGPVYSPNGKYIAYQHSTSNRYVVYVVNADGAGNRLLNDPRSSVYSAAWLEDSFRMVVDTGSNFVIRDLKGANHEVVSASPNYEINPHCSRDGNWMVYIHAHGCEACLDKGTSCSQIWKQNISPMGKKVQLTTGHFDDTHARISYDGSKIVFTSDRNGEHTESIYVMNADGTGLSRVNTPSAACDPLWMPDSRILFVISDADPNGGSMYNIALVKSDGTGLTRITRTVTSPRISPAGGVIPLRGIRITCSTPNAVIRYTTDGSAPTLSSPIYSSPIHFTRAAMVRAKAWKQGMLPSMLNDVEFTATPYYIAGCALFLILMMLMIRKISKRITR